VDFASIMNLEPHGPDTYVGVGPQYPWGGLYGGQIVSQALRAATLAVEPEFEVHSLHAYFIRRGDHDEPTRFEVERVRNGRSFVTRRVVARQAVGAILSMSASFQRPEPGAEVQTAVLPDVPLPDQLDDSESWSTMFSRRFVTRSTWSGEAESEAGRRLGPGRAAAWLRNTEPVADEPGLQSCALAYLSDDIPTDAVVAQHPDRLKGEEHDWWSASLDHAIWFHRPLRADEWHLYDFTCHGLLSSRGLAVGHVFTLGGSHVATIAQEVLLRRPPKA
jgi:acyl-CoA thioesterase-2